MVRCHSDEDLFAPRILCRKIFAQKEEGYLYLKVNIYFKFQEYLISKHYPPTEQLSSILPVLLS